MAQITVQELATTLDTDARTARKFLRSITPKDAQPGKGSRWAIEKRDVAGMRKKFAAFSKAAEDAKQAREAKANADEEPTDADLEAIEQGE